MIVPLLLAQLANAHVVYEVKGARAELWLTPARAHLKLPDRQVYWDLVKERRLDLFADGRSRDEPISFGRIIQGDELFPRGWRLPRRGQRRILGRTCQMYSHQQEVPGPASVERSSFAWCVWRGVPLSLDYGVSVCRGKQCTRSRTRWTAVELAVGGVKESDVRR